ncbi:MAG: right-handed parallel beta-helix repeat-containing protein [Anaerolineaceae bacterium]|nr:right-handed parallel beta-helix repeat-containing protein [Anaerolineaceae bacterium]
MRHQRSLPFWGPLGVLAAFCLIFILPAQPVRGQTGQLFVSSWGWSDSCEQSQPCTIETAQGLWEYGDTVYLEEGYYFLSSAIFINKPVNLVGGWDGDMDGDVVIDPVEYPTVLMDVSASNDPFIEISNNVPNGVHISGITFNGMASGGIAVDDGSTLIIERNHFENISPAVEVGEEATIFAVNNIFDNCGYAFRTEEFIMNSGIIHLVNNTFNDAIHVVDVMGYDVSAINNIFSNISSYVINQNASEVDASHNLLYASELPGTLPEGSWITGDPQFVDPDSGDFHIRVSSPARDAGTTPSISGYGTPSVDYDGQARPNEEGFDIGADEYYQPDLTPTFLPLFLN